MKVFYDHQVFSWQKAGGVSRYFIELMKRMPADIECALPPMLSENIYLREIGAAGIRSWDIANFRVRKKLYETFNRLRSSAVIARGDFGVFHPTYYSPYFLRRLKCPYIITVHDFIHEKFPRYFTDAHKVIADKRKTVMNAHRIIAISEHTRRDLVDIYGISSGNVTVIHHGASPLLPVITPVPEAGDRFILFVGDRTKYKNFNTLAEAFPLLLREDPDLRLVCAGKPFSTAEKAFLDRLGVYGRSMALFASDAQLAWLYAHTSCFVFPSFYEGFGLPILEAWSAGAPVAVSRASCFPEIAGEAAVYFDPADPQSLAKAVTGVITNPLERTRLRELSDARVKLFTWQDTAARTADVYRSLT